MFTVTEVWLRGLILHPDETEDEPNPVMRGRIICFDTWSTSNRRDLKKLMAHLKADKRFGWMPMNIVTRREGCKQPWLALEIWAQFQEGLDELAADLGHALSAYDEAIRQQRH